MSLAQAGIVCLVVALVLLYLGLVRVHYDMRQLRRLVLEQTRAAGASPPLRLPPSAVELYGRTVLAVSSTCATCVSALEAAREHAVRSADLAVLTYEDPRLFDGPADGLRVVRSPEAWSALSEPAALTPPVLARVRPDGVVAEVTLPTGVGDVTDTLTRWHQEEVGA